MERRGGEGWLVGWSIFTQHGRHDGRTSRLRQGVTSRQEQQQRSRLGKSKSGRGDGSGSSSNKAGALSN